MKDNYKIEVLRKEFLVDHVQEFIYIASDIPKESWGIENYIYELPEKWNLSLIIRDIKSQILVGFIIASDKGTYYHIHKYAVHPDFRSSGIGYRLLEYFEQSICKLEKHSTIGLFVDSGNEGAIRFYSRNGFKFKLITDGMSFYEKVIK